MTSENIITKNSNYKILTFCDNVQYMSEKLLF